MEATPLPTSPGSVVAAACDHKGQYDCSSAACCVDLINTGVTEAINAKRHVQQEQLCSSKRQGLNCIPNASLMSANHKFIACASGSSVRIIRQQDLKDEFSVRNISKAQIADIATLGTACRTGGPADVQGEKFLVCLDSAGHVLVYDMEAKKGWVMIFPKGDAPLLVRALPSEDLFVTVCKTHVTVWSLPKLLAAKWKHKPSEEYSLRSSDDLLLSCGSRADLPPSLPNAEAQILDAAVSVRGELLCALCREHIVTWRLVRRSIGAGVQLQLIQLTSLPHASGICSIRILGNGGLAEQGGCPTIGHEVLVVGSNHSRRLDVHELSPESPENPIGALLQSIRVDSRSDPVSLSVNTTTQDTLVVGFTADVLVFALASGWVKGPDRPFPFAQRWSCSAPSLQLSACTGQTKSGFSLYVHRAMCYTREEEGRTAFVREALRAELSTRPGSSGVTCLLGGLSFQAKSLKDLEAELEEAVRRENYEKAGKLKKDIESLKSKDQTPGDVLMQTPLSSTAASSSSGQSRDQVEGGQGAESDEEKILINTSITGAESEEEEQVVNLKRNFAESFNKKRKALCEERETLMQRARDIDAQIGKMDEEFEEEFGSALKRRRRN